MAMGTDLPAERSVLQPFALPDEQGKNIDLETFRQQRNLVLLFLKDGTAADTLLLELAKAPGELVAEDATTLVILQGNREEAMMLQERLRLPFPVLTDESGGVVGRFCGDAASLYVTDRFREVFAVRTGEKLLSREEILEWLAHINRQCPE
jgi:peroxiredoxin